MKTMPIWLKFNENWTNLTEIPWKWLKFQSNQANLDIDISGNWEEIDRNLATRPYSVAHSTQSGIGRQTDSRIDSHLTFEPVKLLTKWIQSKRSHQHGNANWCLFMLIYAHLCSFMIMSCSYRPTGWPLRRTRSLWAMRRTSLPPAPHHLLHLQQSQVVNQLTLTCRPPDGAAIVVHDRRRSASTRIPRASPENPRSLLGEKWPELPVASARWRHAGPRPNPRHDRNSGANQDVTRHRIENMRHGWNYSAVSRRLHCLTFISESHRRHLGRWRRFARFDAGLNRYPFFENWPGCSKPSSTKFFFEICRFGTRWRFNSR